MQAIYDDKRRFMAIDSSHPTTTSGYLSFGASYICDLLETKGFLAEGLTIYGDNTYVNMPYMTSPFKAVSSEPQDAYNFYHSQIRINIDCAFGMMVNIWAVLRTLIPINMIIKKTTDMVRASCCLHNWLINEHDNGKVPQSTAAD